MSKSLKKVASVYEARWVATAYYTRELVLGGRGLMNRERNDLGF